MLHQNKEWLYRKYIVENLDCVQIGNLVDRDAKTIWYWLKKFDIQTRPRGSNYKQNLLNGRPRGWHHTEETKRKVGKASRERGAVPYLRNGEHWLKTVDPEDNPNWKGGITPKRQEFCRSDKWKRVVKLVWKRDKATCQRCDLNFRDARKRDMKTFHIHHIVPFSNENLRCEPTNLVLLCRPCHYFVHSNDNVGGEFLS